MYLATKKLEFIELDFYFKPVLITSYIFSCKAQELMNTSQYLSHLNPFLTALSYLFFSPLSLPPGHALVCLEARAEPGYDTLGCPGKARAVC